MKNLLLFSVFALFVQILSSQILGKQNLKSYSGYFDFYYDESEDKIYLEVEKFNEAFLYVNALTTGVGNNDIGLDRGQLGNNRVVYFKKAGNKLLLVQPNQDYRANTDNSLERKSIEQAFAKSVLFGFKILETNGNKHIVDFTPFLLQDTHEVSKILKNANEGYYKIDHSKSALELERTKAFPNNVEFEVLLTFEGDPTGNKLRSVVPTPSLVTVTQHHSFVKLPDNHYKPREFDPRSGAIPIAFMDYATPIQEAITKRFVTRHRLEKKNPNVAISEAKEPIIYYLDPGTPEPVRSALLEGASWWNEAFEAIGYKDAFQVKMLPEDADPLDSRYNVIQWVHRSTRGWSYGASITDPRTGEIIKGHVSLGSLRIRQDFMIAQALMSKPFAESDANYKPMLEMALARIRQLSAHEVGHTLGFAHNFAASTNARASVMDYPHPQLQLKNGKIDFGEAYDTGIGEWDKVTVAYSYSEFDPSKDEKSALNEILDNAKDKGLRFISDSDARSTGGAHAFAHLWDNGANVVDELNDLMKIRESAIKNFSVDNIRLDEPYSVLEDVFVPLYFYHRYQTEAVTKLIGGLDYNYAVKGDGQMVIKSIDRIMQESALRAILKTLEPKNLAIPKDKLDLFPPRAYGFYRTRESFKSRVDVAFDPLSAANTASDMTLIFLLNPERCNRLVLQSRLHIEQLNLKTVLNQIIDATIKNNTSDTYLSAVQNEINTNVLKYLMSLAVDKNSYFETKAIAQETLSEISTYYNSKNDALSKEFIRCIKEFKEHPEKFKLEPAPRIPDGSPIGMDACIVQTD